MHFFNSYPRFYETGRTLKTPNRLNSRYRALILSNEDIILNRSVLDLASHDGRWSFAALKAGARLVRGIEGRSELVDEAYRTFQSYGMDATRYSFTVGDIHQELKLIPEGAFDTIFCFGFFYHTMHHMPMLDEFARIAPRDVIVDTAISGVDTPIIEIQREDSTDQQNATSDVQRDDPLVLVGSPSRSALDLMLGAAGFRPRYFDWHTQGIEDWSEIEDYKWEKRVSLVAENQARTAESSPS